jgi:UDP-N-acetylglucosamine 2-epimerase (non-hydrolysing)
MKVMTILGTRPEIIRLSLIIDRLDSLCQHVLVHTGQNYDPRLSDVFFEEMGIRRPDHYLGAGGDTLGEQVGEILLECEKVLGQERPDRLLVLGDTNSALSAFIAKRMGVPVYHMEAGNRCYDDRVPEEVNRRVIDHSSDVLMPYTERSRQNLLAEGILGERIYVVGNPISEVIRQFAKPIDAAPGPSQLGLAAGGYFLATIHRAENVDNEERLRAIVQAMQDVHQDTGLPGIVSLHPHTRRRLEEMGIALEGDGLAAHAPFGFFDFVALERGARCLLTDSGTVQEEAAILGIPSVTLRDTTERPETVECGSNILSGVEPESVVRCVRVALANQGKWKAPPEYLAENVSDTVVGVVLGYSPDEKAKTAGRRAGA